MILFFQATNDVKDNVSTHSADISASDSGHGSHDDRENRPTSVELQLDAGNDFVMIIIVFMAETTNIIRKTRKHLFT